MKQTDRDFTEQLYLENRELRMKVQQLSQALQFYANEESWWNLDENSCCIESEIERDDGRIARQALKDSQ